MEYNVPALVDSVDPGAEHDRLVAGGHQTDLHLIPFQHFAAGEGPRHIVRLFEGRPVESRLHGQSDGRLLALQDVRHGQGGHRLDLDRIGITVGVLRHDGEHIVHIVRQPLDDIRNGRRV